MAEVIQIKGPDGKLYSVRLPEGKTAADLPSDPKIQARLLARLLKSQQQAEAPKLPVRPSGQFTNDERKALGLSFSEPDGFMVPPRPGAPQMFGPPKAPEDQGALAVTRKIMGREGGPLDLAARAGEGILDPSKSPARALIGAPQTGDWLVDGIGNAVYGVGDVALGGLGVLGGAIEGAAGLVGDAYNAGASAIGVENPRGLALAKDLIAASDVAIPELAGVSSAAMARTAGSFVGPRAAAAPPVGAVDGPYNVRGVTAGEAPGVMNYLPPAVIEADPVVSATEIARKDAQDYLAGLAPVHPIRENAAVGQAALDLGIQVPRGAITDPKGVVEAMSNPLMMAGDRNALALEAAKVGLSTKFGSVVQEIGNPRTSLGATGDKLRNAVMTKINKSISDLSREYDEFDSSMDSQKAFQLPEELVDSLYEVTQRRLAAGSDGDDLSFIGEIANLINKNIVIPDHTIIGSSGTKVIKGRPLSKLPGVTWQGLKDARSGLRAITANFSKGSQLTPKQRDMITMSNAITEGMTALIRQYAPNDKAEAMVDQFLDLDRRYAIAQDARREMEELFNPESVSIMTQLRKAFNDGGETATKTIERLRGLGGQAWDDTKAVMLHNFGAADDGMFDSSKFATQWGGVAPEVKDKLLDKSHRSDLDAIAVVGKRLASIKEPSTSSVVKNSINTLTRTATMFVPGFAIADGANAASMLGRVFSARALANPYTAKQAAKLYRAIEKAESGKTDAAKALGYTQFSNQLKRYAVSAGIGGVGALGTGFMSGFFNSNMDRDPTEEREVTESSLKSRFD